MTITNKVASVRLQGGLGDHILGMRILPFIKRRYPNHDIIAFSDSGGFAPQLEVASMSPLVSQVIPVYPNGEHKTGLAAGRLENIRVGDLQKMLSTDIFIDAFGRSMFAAASIALDVPIFDILVERPALVTSIAAKQEASRILANHEGASFVAMNLTKYGPAMLQRYWPRVSKLLDRLFHRPDVIVLNLFTSSYEFGNWPEKERTLRREVSRGEAVFLQRVGSCSDRIFPCVDLPVPVVAALLERCRYFIGVDNGIKHLAWALGVPHTFFHFAKPTVTYALRWMPDLNRMLLFESSDELLDAHAATAVAALSGEFTRTAPMS
jgi:ADP-heptose:LPS heptosyltransferase